ncbi:MAG: sigma-70 family RNA polymerase sigma factor [Williamsia sp.]|nr:sigma-70 family RNA polymerase sigma factor [Williamsia sp.]
MSSYQNLSVTSISELIQGCINGERHSQSRLYEALSPRMFVVCLRYARNREEAEEVLQEGFMRVFEHIRQYKFTGSFEGWVRKIMVNCALSKYRSKSQLHAVANIDVNNVNVDYADREDILSKISVKELIGMVQQLPPAYRMVFNLYVFEGMKHREIAAHLNISEGTSKSNLSDARAILQKNIASSLLSVKQNVNEL